jgi:LysM repeat protein
LICIGTHLDYAYGASIFVIPRDRPNRLVIRLRLACTIAFSLTILLAMRQMALATPTEEDLPPVASGHASSPDASTPDAANSDQSDDTPRASGSDAQAPSDPSSQSGQTNPQRPHNYFPYTIRPGDTPQSIANIFGIETTELTRINHITDDTGLIVGHTLRIPNPYLARMRDLEGQIDRLTADRAQIDQDANSAKNQLSAARDQVRDLTASNRELGRQVVVLPWWRTATYMSGAAAVLMFGVMIVALIEWLNLRGRFRAVAEMNEALRRLDYRYRTTVAKAELRLQELYGRRRRGLEDGQDRPRIAEDAELERLHQQLKEILEAHLARLGPPGERARRARWRELIGGIGAPAEAEARSARR